MTLQTEIIIDAPAATVWHILTDLSRYGEWNPFIIRSEGEVAVGARLRNTMRNGDRDLTFTPKVLRVEPERRFEWLGSLWVKGLFDGRHYFGLELLGAARCKLIHGEHFSGILSSILLKQIGEDTRRNFVAMNQALKMRCEAKMGSTET